MGSEPKSGHLTDAEIEAMLARLVVLVPARQPLWFRVHTRARALWGAWLWRRVARFEGLD